MIASRRKSGAQLRAWRLKRVIALAHVLVAVAIGVAVCACVLLLMEPGPALGVGS